MRLISLDANHSSFHRIPFSRTGVSVILGKKTTDSTRKTYNGVGKSLALEIIHFCLGSSKNTVFEDKIPDWTFTLRFEIQGAEREVTRSTSSQDQFLLDGKSVSGTTLRDVLFEQLFTCSQKPPKYLTFRSLLPQFLRRGKAAYVDIMTLSKQETDYQRQLRAAFLLGLDVSLCHRKWELKESLDDIQQRIKSLEADSILRAYFTGGGDAAIASQDLREKISRVKADIEQFRVADDYADVRAEADTVREQLQRARNSVAGIERAIGSIDESLGMNTDLPTIDVERLYREAQVLLPEYVVRSVAEVQAFRLDLLEKRRARLATERVRLRRDLEAGELDVRRFSDRMDYLLQYLSSHGALGELVDLTTYLAGLERQLARVEELAHLEKEYRTRRRETQLALLRESELADAHLEDLSPLIRQHFETFRAYSRRFYPEKPGGLTIVNNEGENRIRFDIDAHIEDDASDGIGEVKMFCYDMTLLTSSPVHNVETVFHDSRLYANVDPRQRAEMMRVALALPVQYVVSLNEDQLMSMEPHLEPEEFDRLCKCVVVELTDEDAKGKLLGVQVDMPYD